MRVAVFDANAFEPEPLLAKAADRHEMVLFEAGLNINTVELARGFEAVSLFVSDDGSAEVLERLAEMGVRYLTLRSAGFNHVDIERARKLGMKVANVPEYSPYAVAEHTVALMLALNRKLVRAHRRVMDLNFSLRGLTGFDMHGKSAAVVGLGRIGEQVARILYGFGCHILAFDLKPNSELTEQYGVKFVDLDTLCREADIISLHVPLNHHTRYIIDAPQFELMKKGVMLINTSRGGLVNTRAAIGALKSGKLGYLGLDVYEEENGLFFRDHSEDILQDDVIARLMTFQNVLITSHQAFLTAQAVNDIATTTIENLDRWQDGDESENELT